MVVPQIIDGVPTPQVFFPGKAQKAESIKYQFYSLWFDSTGARTLDLQNETDLSYFICIVSFQHITLVLSPEAS